MENSYWSNGKNPRNKTVANEQKGTNGKAKEETDVANTLRIFFSIVGKNFNVYTPLENSISYKHFLVHFQNTIFIISVSIMFQILETNNALEKSISEKS